MELRIIRNILITILFIWLAYVAWETIDYVRLPTIENNQYDLGDPEIHKLIVERLSFYQP